MQRSFLKECLNNVPNPPGAAIPRSFDPVIQSWLKPSVGRGFRHRFGRWFQSSSGVVPVLNLEVVPELISEVVPVPDLSRFGFRFQTPGTTPGQLLVRNSSMLVCVVPGSGGRL